MTPEQMAAYVMAQAAYLMATVAGMQAENSQRERNGLAPAYGEDAFEKAIAESGCTHNAVYGLYFGR